MLGEFQALFGVFPIVFLKNVVQFRLFHIFLPGFRNCVFSQSTNALIAIYSGPLLFWAFKLQQLGFQRADFMARIGFAPK